MGSRCISFNDDGIETSTISQIDLLGVLIRFVLRKPMARGRTMGWIGSPTIRWARGLLGCCVLVPAQCTVRPFGMTVVPPFGLATLLAGAPGLGFDGLYLKALWFLLLLDSFGRSRVPYPFGGGVLLLCW